MRTPIAMTRRRLLQCATLASVASVLPLPRAAFALGAGAVRPVPLDAVRLKPSIWLSAVEANRTYLHRLEPDRLLHDYRVQAGLPPKGERYGGWEQDTIAGHSLGHYLSALSLMHAQTGDAACRSRAVYIVAELAQCQRASKDGFVGAFTRRNESTGSIEPGRRVMEEIARGDIRSARFYLNGCWAPFYNWHKLLAGLLDADSRFADAGAIEVAAGLAAYVEATLSRLDQSQVQAVLGTEFGGMSEALVELHARTREARWLRLAERFHHHAVLDPLIAGRDELAYLHANTQIPKVIGLARHAALTGDAAELSGARFFWRAVTQGRSYVIGGNSDREYFQEPASISRYITEQTCESCNTYNMLKLTRLLYVASPDASYFDYYERAHLNHILAQHRPADGMFAYMVPLMSGAAREWSQPFDSFWCCVGTGMESHSKHGDSIYWQGDGVLFVNLYIPSELRWAERDAVVSLDTAYPFGGQVTLAIDVPGGRPEFEVALRLPAWCKTPAAHVNGEPVAVVRGPGGYLRLRRRWSAGDRVMLDLPMGLRLEPTPDDPSVTAVLNGPVVLAADLGPASDAFDGAAPALVGDDVLASISAVDAAAARFRTRGSGRPDDLELAPFFSQHDRRTAVYFSRYSPSGWQAALREREAGREAAAALDARSLDVVRLGVESDERAHALASAISYAVSYRFRPGRDARTGGFMEFDAAVRDEPLVLRATYWGGERDRRFHVVVEGVRIATVHLEGEQAGAFIDRDYPIPPELARGKGHVRVRFDPEPGYTAGPVFGCRVLAAAP